jgi:predicted Rossmann fold nucleotide-binding protein DprA/Smf involved in DNA uptake
VSSRSPNFPDTAAVRLARGDPLYPAAFEELQENAPTVLWLRGQVDLLAGRVPMVAIVGTRQASPYGLA